MLFLPILIPFAAGILGIFFWSKPHIQRWVTLVAMLALLVASVLIFNTVLTDGIQAVQSGNWVAPIGITIVVDLMSAILVMTAALLGSAVAIYSFGAIDDGRAAFGYFPLLSFLLMGICGAFVTGDMFNLYVWFEVMLISSFVLLALGGERNQLEGALKYMTINLISSMIFLIGLGILYSVVGTLNMADIAVALPDVANQGMVTPLAMLFMTAFGIKAAMFPLYFWLPASYHTPPPVISAIFAGLLTKVGIYTLTRMFTLIFIHQIEFTHTVLLVMSGFTMFFGVLGAVAQNEIRRILSFHSISQIGYMMMGLGLYSVMGLAGAIIYMVHHSIVKANLFLISGVIEHLGDTDSLKKIGGYYKNYPLLAILFALSAFALAGIPPLSGFWAKFAVVRAGLELESLWIVGVALLVGLLTTFSMTKIWAKGFWKPAPDTYTVSPTARGPVSMLFPIAVLVVVTMAMGIFFEPIYQVAEMAAEQLLDPSQYIAAVNPVEFIGSDH